MGMFNNEFEIRNYNLVTESNQVIPNYDLDSKELSIVLYLSPDETVCIIGKVDNNYICWVSITNLNDVEKNTKIFNYIANTHFAVFSQESLAVGHEMYDEIRNWYKCEITRPIRKGMTWRTPFGHYYGETNDINHHGQFLATDIPSFYKELLAKCSFRIQSGYTNILRNYLGLLTKETEYNKMKLLISILEQESYLRLSPDKTVRELYLKCMKQSDLLYNRYMDRVR